MTGSNKPQGNKAAKMGCRTLLVAAVIGIILVWRYSALTGINLGNSRTPPDTYVHKRRHLTPFPIPSETTVDPKSLPIGTERWTRPTQRKNQNAVADQVQLDAAGDHHRDTADKQQHHGGHQRHMSLMETVMEDLELTLGTSANPPSTVAARPSKKKKLHYDGSDFDVAQRLQLGIVAGSGTSLSLLCLLPPPARREGENEGDRTEDSAAGGSHQHDCERFFESATITHPISGVGGGAPHPVALAFPEAESAARAKALAQDEGDDHQQHEGVIAATTRRSVGIGAPNDDDDGDYDFIRDSAARIALQVNEQGAKMHQLAERTLHGKVLAFNFSSSILRALREHVGNEGGGTPKISVKEEKKKTDKNPVVDSALTVCPETSGFGMKAMGLNNRKVKLGATITTARALHSLLVEQPRVPQGVKAIRQFLKNSVVTYVVLTDYQPPQSADHNETSTRKPAGRPSAYYEFLNDIGAILGYEKVDEVEGRNPFNEGEGDDNGGIQNNAFDPPTPEIKDDPGVHCAYKALSPWSEEEEEGSGAGKHHHPNRPGFSLEGATVLRFTCQKVKESATGFQTTCANLLFGGGFGGGHHTGPAADHNSPITTAADSSSQQHRLMCHHLRALDPQVEGVIKLGTKTAIYKGAIVQPQDFMEHQRTGGENNGKRKKSNKAKSSKVVWKQFDPLQYSTFVDYRKLAASAHKTSPLINHPTLSCLAVSQQAEKDPSRTSKIKDALEGYDSVHIDDDPSAARTKLSLAVGGFVWQAQPFQSSEGNLKQYMSSNGGSLSWPKKISLAMSIACTFSYLHSHPLGVFTYDDNHPEQYLVSRQSPTQLSTTLIDIDTLQLAVPTEEALKAKLQEREVSTATDALSVSKGRNLKQYKTRCRCFFCKGRSNCLFINTVLGLKDCDQWKADGDRTTEKFRPFHTTPRNCDASSDLHFIAQLYIYLVKGSAPWPGKGLSGVVKNLKDGKYPQAASGDADYDAIVEDLFTYANTKDEGMGKIHNTADLLERLGALCAKHACGLEPKCPALLPNPKSSRYLDVLG